MYRSVPSPLLLLKYLGHLLHWGRYILRHYWQGCNSQRSRVFGVLSSGEASVRVIPCFLTGDQFALSEAIIALAMLMRRFELGMAAGAPPVSMTTVCAPLRLSCAPMPLAFRAHVKSCNSTS